MKNVFIIGVTPFAELVASYMNHNGQYRVAGFSAEREYITRDILSGIPVVPFESAEENFDVEDFGFFVAVGYKYLNAIRARLYEEALKKGYKPVSYIDKHAMIGPNVSLGEHVFIFENVVIQPRTVLDANTIVCASTTISHDCNISRNCFFAAGAVVGGNANIGANCFIGMNATIFDQVNVGDRCIVGAGARVAKDLPPNTVIQPAQELIVSGVRTEALL